jgi:hypothetical protein
MQSIMGDGVEEFDVLLGGVGASPVFRFRSGAESRGGGDRR